VSGPARITLLTDFGTRDGYAAAMKGVIAALAPRAIIDDASHDIAPGDVEAAAWALAGYWRLYETPVVHVAVVDPGVGGRRRALLVRADGRLLVGPDNGVFTRVLREAQEVGILALDEAASPRPGVSGRPAASARHAVAATFHGRDIFAPIAAHLALGVPFEELGRPVADPVLLPVPEPRRDGHGRVHGVVVHVDRFGNLVTNIPQDDAPARARVAVCGRECALVRTYADVEAGQLLALVGSRGVLEVSVRDGSAASLLAAERGATVIIES
jgi:S-adenosyl-L-methionine hydrolase (adenosine-forming)